MDPLGELRFRVGGKPKHLLLDEVQNPPKWELLVNRLQRQGFRLTITGSNAHLLSSKLVTHLTGRQVQIVFFPFSFAEYLHSLAKRDKSALFDVFYGETKSAPLVRECPVNLECAVVHLLDLGSHTLVVGEIVETYVTEDCLKGGTPDAQKIDPLVFLPSGREYWKLGTVIAKAFEVGKDV